MKYKFTLIQGQDLEGNHHNQVTVYLDKSGKKRIRKWIKPTWDEYPTNPSRLAAKEVAASQIGKLLGMETPNIRHITQDGNHYVDSDYIEGKGLHELPRLSNWKKLFHETNRESVIKSALFNYIINNADTHFGNYRLTNNNKLIPIDYELSFHHADDDLQPAKHPNLWEFFEHNHELFNKQHLHDILSKKDAIKKIYDTVKEHYPASEHRHIDNLFETKMQTLENLLPKNRLTYEDLGKAIQPPEDEPYPDRTAPVKKKENENDKDRTTLYKAENS